MMDVDVVLGEPVRKLCAKAERACHRRLQEIERSADPQDAALHEFLRLLERREPAAFPDAEDVEPSFLELHFPSTRERLGEAPLNREAALYFVESLKEEAALFFRRLAEAVSDEAACDVCRRLALAAMGEVARLREVLL